MSDPTVIEHAFRGFLALEVFVVLLLFGGWIGDLWHDRGWAVRTVLVGAAAANVYVLAGQVKAFNLGVPFDWVSGFGLLAYTALATGLIWVFVERHRHPRDRDPHGRDRGTRRGR